MATVFVEDSLSFVFPCAALALIFLVWWFQTGEKLAIAGIVLFVMLAGSAVIADRLVLTERERVVHWLTETAGMIEEDDSKWVIDRISPEETRLRGFAEKMFSDYVVKTAKIGGDLKVDLFEEKKPPEAKATFSGRIDVEGRKNPALQAKVLRKFSLRLQRLNNRWYIVDYHEEPFGVKAAPADDSDDD